VDTAFLISRTIGAPRWLRSGEPASIPTGAAILAVAGIARPDRFFADLEAAHLRPSATLVFRDHHPYSDADIERIARSAHDIVLTTEKDAVRLSARNLGDLRVAAVPLTAAIEPSFAGWLFERIRQASAPGAEQPASGSRRAAGSHRAT